MRCLWNEESSECVLGKDLLVNKTRARNPNFRVSWIQAKASDCRYAAIPREESGKIGGEFSRIKVLIQPKRSG